MTWKRAFSLVGMLMVVFLLAGPGQAPAVQAVPDILASPLQAGCYLARRDRCKIHVEPFTINLSAGQKLVRFQLVAARAGSGQSTVIYDWRPDVGNPPPLSGSAYNPSPVAKDFGVSCGGSYTLSLQGMDSGDGAMVNLGVTSQFTCPTGTFLSFLPVTRK